VFGVVEKMVTDNRTVTLYNLRVSDYHTYFVGCDDWGFSVWAHNAEYTIVKLRGGGVTIVDSEGKVIGGVANRSGGAGFADEAAARAWAKDNIEAGNTVRRDLRRVVDAPPTPTPSTTTPSIGRRGTLDPNSETIMFREGVDEASAITGSKVDRYKPFNQARSDQQPIRVVVHDGKNYIVEGNHRIYGAGEDGVKQVGVIFYTPEEWAQFSGSSFRPWGTNNPHFRP
jgi:hypothetical protein